MNTKHILQNLALLAFSCFFMLIMLEIMFRFLPVYDGFSFVSVNDQQPVFHAKPDRVISTSKDWNFFNARKIRINNVGFRNDQDYTKSGSGPLIAAIGDSYVEAVQVDYEDTFYGSLAQKLDKKARVYSFGYSGAPLSQYLAWAQYATQTFGADHLNFTIISNDFDESLSWHRPREGFLLYKKCEEKTYCLHRDKYQIGPFRPIVEASAFARYLVFNLQVMELVKKVRQNWSASKTENQEEIYVANVKANVDEQHLAESKKAVDFFFRDLPKYTGLKPNKITFTLDGRFYEDSDKQFESSYFAKMRRYFTKTARAKGYKVIDMKPVFADHFSQNGQYFEFEHDKHWNELGHQLVAEELYKYYNSKL